MNKGYNKISVTKEQLVKEYVTNDKSCETIARELNVSAWWVLQRLRQYDISVKRPGASKFLIDVTGKRFGHYTTIKRVASRADMTYWLCRCDCGRYSEIASPELRKGEAKSCGKCENSTHWKGVGELSGHYFCAIQNRARRKKLKCTVTKPYLWELFLAQERKCALTGIPLVFVHSYGSDSTKQTASLDRIDSNLGYIKGNVRWLHKAVNIMRWHMTDAELLHWAKLIVDGPLSLKE